MAGATDAEPSRTLLDELDLHIKPMPVPPWVREREPTPDGPFFYPSEEQPEVEFYAAWPVTGAPGGVRWPSDIRDPYKKPVLAGNSLGDGQAFLLGDTAFGLKKNFEEFSRNPRFWESSLKNWLGHEPPKPPAGAANSVPLNVGPIPGLPKSSASQGAKP